MSAEGAGEGGVAMTKVRWQVGEWASRAHLITYLTLRNSHRKRLRMTMEEGNWVWPS